MCIFHGIRSFFVKKYQTENAHKIPKNAINQNLMLNLVFGKILITPGVFDRFGQNLVCIIPVGVSKMLMRDIFIFAFLPVLSGFMAQKT